MSDTKFSQGDVVELCDGGRWISETLFRITKGPVGKTWIIQPFSDCSGRFSCEIAANEDNMRPFTGELPEQYAFLKR